MSIGGSTDLVNLGSFTLALHHIRGNETTTARLPIRQHGGAVLHGRCFAERAALGALCFACVCHLYLTVVIESNLEGEGSCRRPKFDPRFIGMGIVAQCASAAHLAALFRCASATFETVRGIRRHPCPCLTASCPPISCACPNSSMPMM